MRLSARTRLPHAPSDELSLSGLAGPCVAVTHKQALIMTTEPPSHACVGGSSHHRLSESNCISQFSKLSSATKELSKTGHQRWTAPPNPRSNTTCLPRISTTCSRRDCRSDRNRLIRRARPFVTDLIILSPRIAAPPGHSRASCNLHRRNDAYKRAWFCTNSIFFFL